MIHPAEVVSGMLGKPLSAGKAMLIEEIVYWEVGGGGGGGTIFNVT